MRNNRVLLKISAILIICFLVFSFFVYLGIFKNTDLSETYWLQNSISRKADIPFGILTIIGSAEVTGLISLALILYFYHQGKKRTAISLLLFFSSFLVEIYGKIFIYHPGPSVDQFSGRDLQIITFPSSYFITPGSYPSGHSTRSSFLITFLLCLVIARYQGKYKKIIIAGLVIFLIIMEISRVYLAEHRTSDVIGGLLLGTSLGLISGATLNKIKVKD